MSSPHFVEKGIVIYKVAARKSTRKRLAPMSTGIEQQKYEAMRMGQLDGKIIIVTGAGAGFGRGIVQKLTSENASVLAVDINGPAVTETVSSITNTSPDKCTAHTADITSETSWHEILKAAVETYGHVDTLVNCAGVVHIATPSHEVSEDEFDRMFKVNVKPIYLSTKVMVPYWKSKGIEGHVINMSSISDPRPRPMLVWYASSKGAVTVATKGLAAEYAPDKIRYNCIRPVVGDTAMLPRVLGGQDTPEGRQKVIGGIPLGRMCTPEDVGNMVCFLASDAANYLTGSAFDVDGGRNVS